VQFARNVAWVFASSAAALPIGLATSILLARWLTVDDRGLYALLTTFTWLVFLLTQLGWGDAVIYRTHRHGVSPARAFSTGLVANGAVACAAFAVCLVFREPLTRAFLGDVSARAFWLAAATAPLLTIGDLLRGYARALDRFDLHNLYGILQLGGVLAALLVALPGLGGGLEAAVSAVLAVQVALVAGFGARIAALTGVEWRFDPPEALASLAYGAVMCVQNVLVHLHERVDVFLLAALSVSAFDIGLYAAAVSVVSPLRLIPGALGTVLLPRLAGALESDAAEFTAAVVRPTLLVMAATALGLAAVGAVAIPLLFGAAYAPAVTPFLVLLPGVTLVTVSRVLARYFAAIGNQRPLVILFTGVVLLNFALNLVLIPRFGILGAALASLVSYACEAAGATALFLSYSGRGLRATFLPRRTELAEYAERLRALVARAR